MLSELHKTCCATFREPNTGTSATWRLISGGDGAKMTEILLQANMSEAAGPGNVPGRALKSCASLADRKETLYKTIKETLLKPYWHKLVICLVITQWKSIKLKSDFHLLPFIFREILVFLVTLVYRWVHPFSRNANLNDSPTFLSWLPGCWGTSDDFLSLCVWCVQGPWGTNGTRGGPGGKGSKGQEVRHSTPVCLC